MKHPNRVMQKVMDAETRREAARLRASGVALDTTDLSQALRLWNEIVQDEGRLQAEKNETQTAQEVEARAVATAARHSLMERQRHKCTMGDPSTDTPENEHVTSTTKRRQTAEASVSSQG